MRTIYCRFLVLIDALLVVVYTQLFLSICVTRYVRGSLIIRRSTTDRRASKVDHLHSRRDHGRRDRENRERRYSSFSQRSHERRDVRKNER